LGLIVHWFEYRDKGGFKHFERVTLPLLGYTFQLFPGTGESYLFLLVRFEVQVSFCSMGQNE